MSTSQCETEYAVVKAEPRPTARELWQHYHQSGGGEMENALVERYLPQIGRAHV